MSTICYKSTILYKKRIEFSLQNFKKFRYIEKVSVIEKYNFQNY